MGWVHAKFTQENVHLSILMMNLFMYKKVGVAAARVPPPQGDPTKFTAFRSLFPTILVVPASFGRPHLTGSLLFVLLSRSSKDTTSWTSVKSGQTRSTKVNYGQHESMGSYTQTECSERYRMTRVGHRPTTIVLRGLCFPSLFEGHYCYCHVTGNLAMAWL
ncbi:hypothetical protein L1987_24473 [Smallanthus sonchifolius]|uniref:Uncharacterized protein n=1 Tax=Smallanthus sonchifolius TaxID=185202 RepID=A0ACB9IKB2_9ASTR|nr:hypothetical protein L1987_24473 [Smallanthus sonchifolius]